MGKEIAISDSEIISADESSNNITKNNTTKKKSIGPEEEISHLKDDDNRHQSPSKTDSSSPSGVINKNGGEAEDNNLLNEKPKLCVAPTNNQFKLRIIPLERLLERPLSATAKTASEPTSETASEPEPKRQKHNSRNILSSEATSTVQIEAEQPRKILPERSKRKDYSITYISSGSSEREDSNSETEVEKPSKTSKGKVARIEKATEESSVVVVASTSKTAITATATAAVNATATVTATDTHNSNNTKQPPKIKKCVVRLKRVALPKTTAGRSNNNSGNEAPTTSAPNRKMNSNSKSATMTLMAAQKSKRIAADSSDSDGSDFVAGNNETAAGASDDDSESKSSASEIMPMRKKRVFNKRKNSSSDDSDFTPKKPAKKRNRIKKNPTSDNTSGNTSGNTTGKSDDDDDEKNKNKRKHIRKIIKTKDLDISTKTATKEEEDRRKRIEERQKLYNQIYEKPDSVEVTELVLDFDEESKKPLLEVDKGLLKKLKPHQVTGVKFMWDACFETLKEAEENPGSGCILAHCMGLGKTLQIVTLTHTLLVNTSKTNMERVLIISPLSTLNNWAREFKQWMGFARKKNIEIYDMSKYKDKATRIFKLHEWFVEGGVCILGYDMYRILANEKAKGLRKKQRETLQESLVDPGPDLVVCDEGHLLKNEKTSISKAVTNMRTKRRIVLTGTPLQNNLKEYYCMIQFIKPNLLGTYKEYLNRFVNPICNGQYTDSTERDIRLMKHRSHILHKLLEGCIQRRDYSVLAPYLPPKHEYVVYTTLSTLQQYLYDFYMTQHRDAISSDIGSKGARLFQDFQDLRRIWTHPMNLRMNSNTVIRKRLLANESDSMEDFIDDEGDEEESNGGGSCSDSSAGSSKSFVSGGGGGGSGKTNAKGGSKQRKTRNNLNVNGGDSEPEEVPVTSVDDPSEWWKRFVADKELNNINHSPKLVILMSLLQQCEAIGDKLLVFSQSLQSLDVIEHFLSLIDSATKGQEVEGDIGDFKGLWKPGIDYFRLDGSSSVEQRESMCKKFNDVSNIRARLFLISTRAGGLGINLVAANRVVIFDVSWNPSHDTQSIFRVYRFGQDKPCYIYRLIAMGTMEQKVYERQVAKQATAKRVIDEQQITRHYNQNDLQELYSYELIPSTEREIPILPKDRLFAELLTTHEEMLFKYHEHDSLLENEVSEHLNEEDRKAAWDEYEAEKTRTVQTAQYISYDRGAFGAQFGNASGSVTSNKIFGFRSDVLLHLLNKKIEKDMPDLTQNQIIQMVPVYLQRLYSEMNNGDPTIYKDLLLLHATLEHPSGMFMNPLLYANQNPLAAGYYQSPLAQQQGGMPPPQIGMPGVVPGVMPGPVPGAVPAVVPTARFNPDEVYEIDD